MTQISTDLKTSVIIFHDKSRKFITKAQESLIFQASGSSAKSITTPALGMITFSAIAKVMDIKDFYDEYPDERPETREEWKETKEEHIPIEKMAELSKEKLKGLLKGLKQYLDEELAKGITPKHALELYNNKLAIYKRKYENQKIS